MRPLDLAHAGSPSVQDVPHGVGVYERPLAPRLHAHLGAFLLLLGAALTAFAVFAIHSGT